MGAPYGWYGDDFTGATDTLATLARHGLKALLFLGVPSPAQLARAGELDAIGIAGAARSMAPAAMREALAPVGRFFQEQGVAVLHYKCCSTFDSAPEVGNLATAIATLRPFAPNGFLPILGGQPNLGRYCLFSTLFAAAGTGGEVFRLDRHPTMSHHPVTPMAEADLRRHLAAQGLKRIGTLPYPALPRADAVVAGQLQDGAEAVLLDVAREEDLAPLGRLIWRAALGNPLVALGPSSVAQALAETWPKGPRGTVEPARIGPAEGPVFLMVGSLSPITRRQVEAACSYEHLAADAGRLVADTAYGDGLRDEVASRLAAGRHVLVATEAPGEGQRLLAIDVAAATARFIAAVMEAHPVRRLGIAGGDTSSLGAQVLDLWGLSCLTTLAPGVTLCQGHSDDPALDGMELMLKGGQMGPPDLFELFLGAPTAPALDQVDAEPLAG